MLKNANKLLRQFSEQINKFPLSFLSVLNVGWEAGTVKLFNDDNEPRTVNISRAGGMAVVVAELPLALIRYGRESNIFFNIVSVSPYIGGAMRDASLSSLIESGHMHKVKEYKSVYAGESFDVEVYEGKTEFGKQYLLKSDAWAGKFGGNMSPYILTLKGQDEKEEMERDHLSSSPYAMSLMEERAYIVFSQAVAKIYDMVRADAAILHDYHSGLSVFYNERINPVLIGHNMAYQGIMGVNMEKDHLAVLNDLSQRLNLDGDTVHKYFRAWARPDHIGAGNILQAVLRKCRERTGISATTVSEGYASELRENIEDIKRRISKRSFPALPPDYFSLDKTKMRIKDFYRSHFDMEIDDAEAERFQLVEESRNLEELRTGNIVGILNGLDVEKHASRNKLLRDIVVHADKHKWSNPLTPLYLKNEVAKDPEFLDGLNFDPAQPARVFKAKHVLRKILLMEFFPEKKHTELWDNKDSFIHYSWGRLVDQKNIPLIVSEAEHMTKHGDILILLAVNPDDPLAFSIEDVAEKKSKELQKKGLKFAFTSKFDVKGAVFAAGADLVHVPSRYEPCGLTDMEAYWMGTPVVANLVGGLGKGGYAVAGFSADPTSMEAMRIAYRKAYHRAVNIKKYYPEKWREVCLEALKLDFSYKKPANSYIDIMYVAMTKPVMNKAVTLAEAYRQGELPKEMYDVLKEQVRNLPLRIRRAYIEYATRFSSYDENKAFFYGVSNDTIIELFSGD